MLDARKDIIGFFEKGAFPYKSNVLKTKEDESEKIKDDYKEFIEYIENESKNINYDLFNDYFDLVVPSD